MARLSPARSVALDLASERRRRGARARDLLRGSSRMDSLDERDRSLATRLVMGSVAAEGRLDHVVLSHVRRPSGLEPRALDALRLAAFELLYLSTPGSVVVSQGVELVRSVAPRAAGLANAVLRRVAAHDVPALASARARVDAGEDSLADLALVGALPEWLVSSCVVSCGRDAARRLALTVLDQAPVYVATNRVRRSAGEARDLLAAAGCGPVDVGLEGAFLLEAPAALARSGLVATADVLPADLAAQWVVRAAAPAPGTLMLEVGQGRGTKTVLMEGVALAAGGPAGIVSVDVDPHKVELARGRMASAGLSAHTEGLTFDATRLAGPDLPAVLDCEFDSVFVDAPCSGTGTLRRHPEIAWSLRPESVDPTHPGSLPALQLAILVAASSRVRPGGRLTYSTCSWLRSEDEQVTEAFLAASHGGFEPVGEPVRVCLDSGRSDTHFCASFVRVS